MTDGRDAARADALINATRAEAIVERLADEFAELRRENARQHAANHAAAEAGFLRVHQRIDEAVRDLDAKGQARNQALWQAVAGLRSRWWAVAAAVVLALLGLIGALFGLIGWLVVEGPPWRVADVGGLLGALLRWLA